MKFIVNLLLILSFVITFFTNCGLISNSALTIIVFIEALLLFILSKKTTNKKFLLAFTLILLLLNYYFVESGIGGLLGILSMFLFSYSFSNQNVITTFVIKLFPLIASFLLLYFFIFIDKFTVNLNAIGINSFYLLLFVVPIILDLKRKSLLSKIISILLFIVCFIVSLWIIIFSQCRSALFGLIGVGLLITIISIYKMSFKLYKYLSLIYLCIGGLTAWGSVYLYKNNIELFFFKWLVTENKQSVFSGREQIWNELIEYFYDSPFLGCGNQINLFNFDTLACHNSTLAILCLYGTPIFLIIFMGLWKFILKIIRYTNDISIRYYYCFFCGVLTIGLFESNLIDDFRFYTILPLILANQLINQNSNLCPIINGHK